MKGNRKLLGSVGLATVVFAAVIGSVTAERNTGFTRVSASRPLTSAHQSVVLPSLVVTDVPNRQAQHPLSEESVARFVDRFDAIFDGPNVEIADEIMAEDFVGHAPLAPELDREGWKDYVASFYAAIPDLAQEVNNVVVGDDRVVLYVTYTGTHDGPLFGIPATGTTITFDGVGIFRFHDDGTIAENWAVLDVVGMLAQIGAFPPAQEAAVPQVYAVRPF